MSLRGSSSRSQNTRNAASAQNIKTFKGGGRGLLLPNHSISYFTFLSILAENMYTCVLIISMVAW